MQKGYEEQGGIFRMAERLSGRWPDNQGFCGVRDFDEPQVCVTTPSRGRDPFETPFRA